MIEFHEEDHTYWYNGIRVPGVSEIIEGAGLTDANAKQHYTKFHADRGTAVHKACELLDKGVLDESSLDPEIVGYVEAYKKFIEEYKPEWPHIELKVFNAISFYAGTLDRFGTIGYDLVVLDIKTGQKAKWHAIQLALYTNALPGRPQHAKLYGLYLKRDGSFKASRDLIDYTDPEAFRVAEAAVRIYQWRQK